jgi:hypothetical protein
MVGFNLFLKSFTPTVYQFWSTVSLGFVLAVAGAILRLRIWRRPIDTPWLVTPYALALLCSLLAVVRGVQIGASMSGEVVVALLGFAVAAYLVAVVERQPAITALSILYALSAGEYIPGSYQEQFWLTTLLTVAIAAVGLVLRLPSLQPAVRRLWSLAPFATAFLCSLLTFGRGLFYETSLNSREAQMFTSLGFLFTMLGFALLASIAAVFERQPRLTILSAAYAILAALLLPGQDTAALFPYQSIWQGSFAGTANFIPTIMLAFAATALGVSLGLPTLRRRVGRAWVLAPYVTAICCAVLALERGILTLGTSLLVAVLLLFFGVTAYLVAALERQPAITALAACYALVGVLLLPDQNGAYPAAFQAFLPGAFQFPPLWRSPLPLPWWGRSCGCLRCAGESGMSGAGHPIAPRWGARP